MIRSRSGVDPEVKLRAESELVSLRMECGWNDPKTKLSLVLVSEWPGEIPPAQSLRRWSIKVSFQPIPPSFIMINEGAMAS